MNRIWICSLIFTFCLGSAAWSQEKKAGTGTEKAIAGLEQQIRGAVIKGDTSILERYLADDYVGIGPNGITEDKSQTIQELKDGTVKYSTIDVTEEHIRMYGNTGIYNGRSPELLSAVSVAMAQVSLSIRLKLIFECYRDISIARGV